MDPDTKLTPHTRHHSGSQRRPFQGVLNILSFNRHFYYLGLGAIILLLIASTLLHWTGFSFWIVIGLFAYGLLMPLIVSAYVYDYSGYYALDWLDELVPNQENIRHTVNINAGFDETSFLLAARYSHATLDVFDFYNKDRHTEPAIKRARQVSMVYPNTRQITPDHIPVEANSVDIIFLLSAVHEIRSRAEKVTFLRSCRHVLRTDGQIIMVEHLRDFPNFLAFTVGFTHFFSSRVWKSAFASAGFQTVSESKFTPFMSIFVAH